MARLQAGDQRRVLVITSSHDDRFCPNLLTDVAQDFRGKHRYQVQSCVPAAALAICQQNVHECILLDWESLDLNGAELLGQLDAQEIPMVVLVSAANEQSLADIISADRDYLVKETLTNAFLGSMIQNAIAQADLKQRLNIAETRLHSYEFTEAAIELSDHCASNVLIPKYERILSATSDWVSLVDRNYIYRIVNQTYLDWFQRSWDEIVGHHMRDVLGDEIFQTIVKPHLDRALTGETVKYDTQMKNSLGSLIFVSVTHAPYREANGVISGVVVNIRDMNDRKLSEIKLRETEERWQLALEGNKDGIWDDNLITNKHFLSKRCLEIVGYEYEEIDTFERWLSFVHPDDLLVLQNSIQRYFSKETPQYAAQYRMKCKDNSYKWVEAKGKAIWDEQGNPVRMIGSLTDISDRKAAESILRQYERVVSATLDGVAMLDRNYIYRIVNDVYLDRNGIKREEIVGYSVAELMGENVFEELIKPRLDLCLAGEVQQYEAWFDYKNAGHRFIRVIYSPNVELDGTIAGVVVSTHDLTEIKQIEVTLAASEKSLANLISNLPGYVYKVHNDPNYTAVFISKGCEAITGYSQAEYLVERSISCGQIIHPDDVDPCWEIVQNAIASRQPYQCEYRIITKTGQEKWVWEQGMGIYDENGDLLFLEGFVTDISDRERIKAELQKLNSELELRVAQRTEALSKSEAILQEAQAIAKLGNWELDVNTRSVKRSPEMMRIFGLTSEQSELSYSEIKQYLHPDDSETLDLLINRAIQEGLPYETDIRFTRVDGTSGYLMSKGKPIFDHEGIVTQVHGVAMDITDRKLVERELQESQRFAEQIADASPNILYLYNVQEQRNVYSNREIYAILGHTPKEIQDMGAALFSNLIHPDDLARVPENMERIVNLADGEVLDMEYRMRCADGEWCWLFSRNSIFSRDLDGKVLLTIGTAQDITARKVAEAALRESERRFERIALSLPGIIFTVVRRIDGSTYFEYVSSGIYELHELTIEQVLQNPNLLHMQHHPEDRANFIEAATRCTETGSSFNHVWRIITPSGKLKWLQISSFPEQSLDPDTDLRGRKNGELARHGIVLDITDRKRAEEKLRESEKRFERIALSLPGLIYTSVIHPDGTYYFEYASSGLERLTELTVEQVFQNPKLLYQLYHPDDREEFLKVAYSAIETKTPIHYELRLVTPSGTVKWINLNSVPEGIEDQIDRGNGITARHGIVLDITDRKLAEIQVQQQADQQHLLNVITQRIRSSLNLQDIINTAVAEVFQLLQASRVLVYQLFADGTGAAIAESVSPNRMAVLSQIYAEEVFPQEIREKYQQGEVYALSDRDTGIVFPCLIEFLKGMEVRAKLVVPIIQDNQLWGLLIVHQCDRIRQWQSWEIDLLQQLSNQLAIAIQQANLYQQLRQELRERQLAEEIIRQQAEREALLREITQRIRQSLDLDTIFATSTSEIRKFLRSDRVAIFKFEPDCHFNDGRFVAESVGNGIAPVIEASCHEEYFGEQYSEAYLYGRYQAVDDIYNSDLSQCHINTLAVFNIRANLIMPLLNGNTLWGLICIHQCSSARHWESTDIELIQQISNQLAIAIQQASLFQQVQTELTDKEKLYLQLVNELHQKKVLLKEVHHRVKNNLQVMSSLLRMQFRKATPELKSLVEDYQNRIQSMALIHAQLHQNDDLAHINFHDYLFDLTTNLIQCYGINSEVIQCNLEVSNIFLPLDQSVPIGLIINELVSNSLKHAFPQGFGEVNIQLTQVGDRYHLKVADNGIGVPADLDLQNTDSLGMQLVFSLTDQLEAKITHINNNGSQFVLDFPVL
jgi:PAS domain S-box-containing protein